MGINVFVGIDSEQLKYGIKTLAINYDYKIEAICNDAKIPALSMLANEDYGYIGQESSLENLDMQKAISDMKKDSVLQEYHYFLGAPENTSGAGMIQSASEDGRVILK